MATITKKELVGRIAEKTKASRSSVKAIVQCFLDEITGELALESILEIVRGVCREVLPTDLLRTDIFSSSAKKDIPARYSPIKQGQSVPA